MPWVNRRWVPDAAEAAMTQPVAYNYTAPGFGADPFGGSAFGAGAAMGATSAADTAVPNAWASTPGASDLQRENARGWKEAGVTAGLAGLGTAAQIGLTMIDTPQDKENKERLAELAKHKGLSQGERADIDEQAMRGVRALAAESQQRDDDALAASGQHSAAALQRSRSANADALNRASIAAADIGIRENRAQVARDVQEEKGRLSYESARQRQRIEMVGQAISDIAKQVATVAAANPTQRAPSDAEFNAMRSSGKYPWLPADNEAARALWTQQKAEGY